MPTWHLIGWILGAPAALYGLHRLALRLEERGHLYYLRKRPKGSAAGAFVALQRAIEPRSQHVEQVKYVDQRVEGDEGSGRGDADPSG